jgi:cysteine-rich repeat protein
MRWSSAFMAAMLVTAAACSSTDTIIGACAADAAAGFEAADGTVVGDTPTDPGDAVDAVTRDAAPAEVSGEPAADSPDAAQPDPGPADGTAEAALDLPADALDVPPDGAGETTPECGNGKVEPGEECDDGNDVPWDGCTGCRLTAFRVNTWAKDRQIQPAVATFADGGFVVVWMSYAQAGPDWSVFQQRYTADGSPDGTEARVNDDITVGSGEPGVGVLDGGRTVIAWTSRCLANCPTWSSFQADVLFRLFDATGTAEALPVVTPRLRPDADLREASVLAATADRFDLFWSERGPDPNGNLTSDLPWYVAAQRFGSDGTPATVAPLQVAHPDNSVVTSPIGLAAAALDEQTILAFADGGISVDLLVAAGATLQALAAATARPAAAPDVAVLGSGYSVAWQTRTTEPPQSLWTWFPPTGAAGSPVALAGTNPQQSPRLAALAGGGLVVAWIDGPDDGPRTLLLQRYASDRTPLGTPFAADDVAAAGSPDRPAVAAFPDGSFIVAWDELGLDGSQEGVYARRFGADGSPRYR